MESKKLSYDKSVQLLELLGKFKEYTNECKKNEYDTNVLFEITKTQNAIRNIEDIIRLEF